MGLVVEVVELVMAEPVVTCKDWSKNNVSFVVTLLVHTISLVEVFREESERSISFLRFTSTLLLLPSCDTHSRW